MRSISRLQDKTSTFKGPMDVLKQIIRKHGLFGLYAGMESTFWRYAFDSTLTTLYIHVASDMYTGTEDISVVFITSEHYFPNLMSVL